MTAKKLNQRTSRPKPAVKREVVTFLENEVSEKKKNWKGLFVIVVLVLAIMGYVFRSQFLVAVVDNKPIFRYELGRKLVSSFGKETLENMIVEKLIVDEARKKSVVIGEEEINQEVEKISKGLGSGMKLEDVLKFQGVSLADFRQQLKVRLQVNKILEKDILITAEEVDKYLKDNAKLLIATGEAERKTEAQEKIKEQKISEKVQTWVSDLMSKAKITRFLK